MNNITIRGENVSVTPALKEYITKKISRLERFFDEPFERVSVKFKVYRVDRKVEVTITLKNLLLRAEETNEDLYAAIDLVVDKLESQIRTHKSKINRRMRRKKHRPTHAIPKHEERLENEMPFVIERFKTHSLQPMSVDEAALQMELLQHKFFVFENIDTKLPNVVYKRNDGTYGLIETN